MIKKLVSVKRGESVEADADTLHKVVKEVSEKVIFQRGSEEVRVGAEWVPGGRTSCDCGEL